MKKIQLTQGKAALVDDADFAELSAHRWHAVRGRKGTFYAARDDFASGARRHIYMHRAILGVDAALQVDHANGDGLDNRRSNLRSASRAQNQQNQGRRADNSSGFKGVCWHAQRGKWYARIGCNGVTRSLGLFDSPELAHDAYCRAASVAHGQFARTS